MAWEYIKSAFKDWQELKDSQQRALIATVVGAVVTAGLAVIYGGVSTQSFISLTLSVAVVLLMDRIARYRFENQNEADLKSLLHKDPSILHIGGTEDGVNWFLRHGTEAVSITNTVVNRSEVRHNPDHLDIVPRFQRGAVKMINRGCLWTDICLPSEEAGLNTFAASLRSSTRSNYEVRCIQPNVPIVQCLVLRFRDNHKEVLFGWGLSGTDKSLVFHSASQDTAEYFNLYCRQLLDSFPSGPTLPVSGRLLIGDGTPPPSP